MDGKSLPPLDIKKDLELGKESRLDDLTVREILKVGLDGKDNVEKYLVSDDPEVRKFCRRIRMERRLRERQRPPDEEEIRKSPTPTENQLICSTSRIEELIEDSLRSIINVRIAAMKNEEERQRIQLERKQEIDTLIQEEAITAQEKFEEINSKWSIISKKKDPLEIHEETERQRDDCVALLEQKDSIIDNLKSRLKLQDREFYDELSKQNDYINILSDRINEQISLMSECYREELNNLQGVINTEKDKVLKEKEEEWREMSKMKELLELENISKRFNYIKQYEEHMDSLLVDQHELMRSQNMKIESRLNKLTLEESRFRSAVLINSELLNYNVQILQKRQAESRAIKGQQKRAVNKLQETVRRLRQQQKDEINNLTHVMSQLTDEMKKSIELIKEAKDRLRMLTAASDKRYFHLWDYNERIARGLVSRLLTLDRKFHRDILNVFWHPPTVEFPELNIRPYYKHAGGKKLWEDMSEGDAQRLTSMIVRTVMDKNDFLMDSNLMTLLQPYSSQCRAIGTVHHIFETLGLKRKQDIDLLVEYFSPYVYCKQCRQLQTVQEEKSETKEGVEESIGEVSRRLSKQLAQMSQITSDIDTEERFRIIEGEVEVGEAFIQQETTKEQSQRISLCKIPNHQLVISGHNVAKALKEFVVKLNEDKRWDELASLGGSSVNDVNASISRTEVESYWERMPRTFPENKRLLWKSLLSQIKERAQLRHETHKLQRQMAELRRLLMRYLQQEHATEKRRRQ